MNSAEAESNLFSRERIYNRNLLLDFKDLKTRAKYSDERFGSLKHLSTYFQILMLLCFGLVRLAVPSAEKRRDSPLLLRDLAVVLQMLGLIAAQHWISRNRRKNNTRSLESWILCKCSSLLVALKVLCDIGLSEGYYFYLFTTCLINFLLKSNWLRNLVFNQGGALLISAFYSHFIEGAGLLSTELLARLSLLTLLGAGIDIMDEVVSKNLWTAFDSSKRSAQVFCALLDLGSEVVYIVDHAGRILYLNEPGRELFQTHLKLNPKKLSRNLTITSLFEKECFDLFERVLSDARNEGVGRTCISLGCLDKEERLRAQFKVKNLYKLTARPYRWKGRPAYYICLSDQELLSNYLRVNEKTNTVLVSSCSKILDKLETDYTKWNNLQSLKYIRESDLKDLSNCVIELNVLKNSLFMSELFVNTILRNDSQDNSNFNIRNTIVQTIELVSVTAVEKQIEIYLKFEDSFPETVYGSSDMLKQLFLFFLKRFLTCAMWPKLTKIHLECTLNKVLQNNKFMLLFSFKFPSNETLPNFFKRVEDDPANLTNYDILEKLVFGSLDDAKIFKILLDSLQADTYFHEVKNDSSNPRGQSFISLEIPFQAPELATVISTSAESKHPQASQASKPLTLSFSRVSSCANNYFWKEKPKTQINPIKFQSRQNNTIIGATNTIAHATAFKKIFEKEREDASMKEDFDSNMGGGKKEGQKKADGDMSLGGIKKKDVIFFGSINTVLPEEITPRDESKDSGSQHHKSGPGPESQKDQEAKKHTNIPTPLAKAHLNESSERISRRKISSEDGSLKEVRNHSTGGSSDDMRKQSFEKIPKLNGIVSPKMSSEQQGLSMAIKTVNSINAHDDASQPRTPLMENLKSPKTINRHNSGGSLSPDIISKPGLACGQIKSLLPFKKKKIEHLTADEVTDEVENDGSPSQHTILDKYKSLLRHENNRYRQDERGKADERGKLDERSKQLAVEIKNELMKQRVPLESLVLEVVSSVMRSRFESLNIVMKKEKPRNRNYSEDVVISSDNSEPGYPMDSRGEDTIKENATQPTDAFINRITEYIYKRKLMQSPGMSSINPLKHTSSLTRSRSHADLDITGAAVQGSENNLSDPHSIGETNREEEPSEDVDSSLMLKLLPSDNMDLCTIGMLSRLFSSHRKWGANKAEQFVLEEDLFVIMIVEEDNYLEKQLEKIEFLNPKKIVKAKSSFYALQNYNWYVTEGFIFGLIIVSLNLYPVNGDYLVHEIRKYEKMQSIPRTEIYGVIDRDQPMEEEGLWDFDHLLYKPFTNERLKKIVNVGNSIIEKSQNENEASVMKS